MNITFGFGSQSLLVIDPGRHTLKIGVGTIGPKGKWARLKSVYTVRTGADPQTTPDQVIERFGTLIQEVIKRHSLSAKQVSFAIPGRASFVRQLKVPKVSGDRLMRLIQYEARQQIPFPLEDIILDHHVFESDTPELGVTLVAVRKTIVDQYCAMLKTAGLVPDTIDVTTLSLFDAFHPQLRQDTEEVVALVDVGASTTDIIVCKKGRIEFIRTAPQAGDQLTKALADQMGIGWEAAEELKVSIGEIDSTIDRGTDPLSFGEGDQAARVRVFLSKAFDTIANEVRRTLDFYVSQPDGEPIGKIYLTGGTANCPGAASFIESRLGIPTEVKSPFDSTLVNVEALEEVPLQNTSAVLLGQCQRNIADVPLRMNFLPNSIVRQKEFEKRRAILAAEGILLSFLIGFSVVTMGQSIDVIQQASNALEDMVRGRNNQTAQQINTYIEQSRSIEDRIEYLRDIGRSQGVISQTLAEVSEKIPLGATWVTGVDMDTTQVTLQLRGDDEISVGTLKEEMQDAARLREIKVGGLTKISGGGGVSFNLTAKVEKNPSPELTRFREKLEFRGVEFLDVTLDDHSDPPGSKQSGSMKVVVTEPISEAERRDIVLDILSAEGDSELGFQSRQVSIEFQSPQRTFVGRYDIADQEIELLLKGEMEVKTLVLKTDVEPAPGAGGMGGDMGMGAGVPMGMGGVPPVGIPPAGGAPPVQ